MNLTNLLASGMLLICSVTASAQPFTPSGASETIDIANIKAAHLVHGDMWWDPADTMGARCEFPKGSGKHASFASGLWMAGADALDSIYASAQYSRKAGIDYWPGPLDTSNSAATRYTANMKWAKIWKINSRDIDFFNGIGTHAVWNTPLSILEWPAKGNPFAKDANGAALTITADMAPFVDVNTDGLYNPLDGDYPKMKGSQMLWWIFNDNGPVHTQTNSLPLMVEVKTSCYAYNTGTVADNIIFYEYEITNKSAGPLNRFRMGIFSDSDLGFPYDDYIGFDSSRRMGISYNGKSIDGDGSSGHYGLDPAMSGISILEAPGDTHNSYQPAGSFGIGIYPLPGITALKARDVNYSLNGRNPQGNPYPNGSPYIVRSPQEECDNNNFPYDRRFLINSGDVTLAPGGTKKFAFAFFAAENTGGCPNQTFTGIQNVADTAIKIYWNPARLTPTGIANIKHATLQVFPNPATNTLNIITTDYAKGQLAIFDAVGRMTLSLPVTSDNGRITVNISSLPNGVYTIRYQGTQDVQTTIFVKE